MAGLLTIPPELRLFIFEDVIGHAPTEGRTEWHPMRPNDRTQVRFPAFPLSHTWRLIRKEAGYEWSKDFPVQLRDVGTLNALSAADNELLRTMWSARHHLRIDNLIVRERENGVVPNPNEDNFHVEAGFAEVLAELPNLRTLSVNVQFRGSSRAAERDAWRDCAKYAGKTICEAIPELPELRSVDIASLDRRHGRDNPGPEIETLHSCRKVDGKWVPPAAKSDARV